MKIKKFDRTPVKIEVPEWAEDDGSGGVAWLKPLCGSELVTYLQAVSGNHQNIRMELLLAICLVDESGKRLFADLAEGEEVLQGADPIVVTRLYSQAVEVSGLGEKGTEEAKKA